MQRGVWLAFLAMATGCLPSRDNPHDPHGAPKAFLRTLDGTLERTPTSRRCMEIGDVVTDSLPVAAVFRGRCTFLDASASVDPQGEDLDDLTFHYAVIATGGVELATPLEIAPDPALQWLALLPTSLTLTLPPRVPITIEARVRDEGGNTGRAETTLVLLNGPPVAIADALRVIPDGGYPWRPALEPVSARFDARRSYDPDGDPLSYLIELADGTILSSEDGYDPAFTVSVIPTDSASALVRVRVSDGDLVSPATISGLTVRPPGVWQDKFTGARALDGRRRFLGSVVGNFDLVEMDGHERLVTSPAIVYPPTLSMVTYPELEPLPSVTVPEYFLRLEPAGDALWVVGSDYATLYDVTDGIFGAQLVLNSNLGGVSATGVGGDGSLWIGAYGSASIDVLGLDGASTAVATVPGHVVSSIASRPGTAAVPGEAWSVQSGDGFGALVQHVSETESRVFLAAALDGAVGLAFIDADQCWLTLADRGFVRFDVDYLVSGASFEDAISLEVPYPVGIPNPATVTASADRLGTYVVGNVGGAATVVVTALGVMETGVSLRGVDRTGELVYGISNFVGTVAIYSGSTILTPVVVEAEWPGNDYYLANAADRDVAFGGAWSLTDRPSLAWMSADGRTKEITVFAREDASGAPLDPPLGPPPRLGTLRVSPDGTHAWGIEGTPPGQYDRQGIWRFDLTADPPIARLVDPTVVPVSFQNYHGLEAVSPDGQDAWVFSLIAPATEDSDFEVRRLSADGTSTVAFTVPVNEREFFAGYGFPYLAPDLRGGLCIGVDRSDMNSRDFTLRHLPSDGGPVQLLTSITLPDPSLLLFGQPRVRASSDRSTDLCWVTWRSADTAWEVRAFDATTGSLERAWTATEEITDFAVVSHDEIWVTDTFGATRVTFAGISIDVVEGYPEIAGFMLPTDRLP